MGETAKREAIIEELVGYLASTAIEGILLTGSMVYGRNYRVTADSDIDLLVILESKCIYDVTEGGPFAGGIISRWGKQTFANLQSDCVWDGFEIDGVVINPGFLSLEFFERWTKLETDTILRDRSDLPSGTKIGENRISGLAIDKTPIQYMLSITHYEDRYTVQKPIFCDDLLVDDMLYGSVLLSKSRVDKRGQIDELVGKLEATIKERYGTRGLLNLVDYGLRRASPEYLESYLARIGGSEFWCEYVQGHWVSLM